MQAITTPTLSHALGQLHRDPVGFPIGHGVSTGAAEDHVFTVSRVEQIRSTSPQEKVVAGRVECVSPQAVGAGTATETVVTAARVAPIVPTPPSTRSRPGPASSTSFPRPPQMRSLRPKPWIRSSPPSPEITSGPGVPTRRPPSADPTIVGARPRQSGVEAASASPGTRMPKLAARKTATRRVAGPPAAYASSSPPAAAQTLAISVETTEAPSVWFQSDRRRR
jgi:hypothetical protein